jgi:hypothetical protein
VALEEAGTQAEAIPQGWLVSGAAELRDSLQAELQEAEARLGEAQTLAGALTGILGGPGEQHRYLVLQQDCYELRPSGGLISTYGVLTTTHDSVVLSEYDRASLGLPVGLRTATLPPEPLTGFNANLRFWDAGWWPDFPETIRVLEQIWAANGKPPVDGCIAIDPVAIGYMLEALGPLEMPEWDEVVTAENLPQKVLLYVDVHNHVAFLESLADHFFDRVIRASPEEWLPLAQALGRALDEKHIQLWFKDPEVQSVFAELDWSGEVVQESGDYLMVVDSNMNGNFDGYKANMWTATRVDLAVEPDAGGLRHSLTYTLDNGLGLADYWSYLRLYLPPDAVLTDPGGFEDRGVDSGKQVMARVVEVPLGGMVRLTVEYRTPAYDTLLLQKQAGMSDLPVTLRLGGEGSAPREMLLVNRLQVRLPQADQGYKDR